MKYCLCLWLLLTACGGTLTDEQRQKLRAGKELNAIRKISEAQIMEATLDMGRSLAMLIEKSSPGDTRFVDSLQKSYKVKIHALQSGDSSLLVIEKQIVEAYTTGSGQVQLDDNVQRIGSDTLLYTRPIMKILPDGSSQFLYAIGISIPKKQVILSIKN